jgi:disulfide bond formation protein DsbB
MSGRATWSLRLTALWVDRSTPWRYAKAGSQDDGMAHYLKLARAQPIASAAIAVAVIGLAAILGAYFFQYVIGLSPCPLCLEQRIAYYVSIPLAALILLGVSVGSSRKIAILALIAIAGFMLWNAGLGVYHSGVEWQWWAGPQDCSGPLTSIGSRGGLLQQLQNIRVARCDEAAWRFLGLSLAGYNALISLTLAAIALWGAAAAWKTRGADATAEAGR